MLEWALTPAPIPHVGCFCFPQEATKQFFFNQGINKADKGNLC